MPDVPLRAAVLSGGDLVARVLVQFAFTAVLARILTPSDFGLVAVAVAVVSILGTVADLGLRTHVVRRPNLDGGDLAISYGLVLTAGLALTLVAAACAPILEVAVGLPGLSDVLVPLSPLVALNALFGVSSGLLVRSLRFGALALVSLASTVSSGTTALLIALTSPGPSALVWMALVAGLVGAVMSTVVARPRLARPSEMSQVPEVLKFGSYVVATSVLDAVTTRVPLFLVGARFGAGVAGQYTRAESTAQTFKELTDSVLGRVALPLLSRSLDDKVLFVAGLRTGMRFGMGLFGPVMLLLAAVATPLTVAVFGPQWVASGPILSALALGVVVWPIHVLAINALLARASSRRVFRLDVRNKLILVGLVVSAASFGATAIAAALSLAHLVAAAFNMRALADETDYAFRSQVRDALPLVLVATPWALGAWLATGWWSAAPVVVGPTLLVVGLLGTALTAHVLGISVLRDIVARLTQAVGEPRG